MLALLFAQPACAEDEPEVIKAAEARKHVGKKVSVTFLVKTAKHSEKRQKYYLDSEEDFRDEKNLGIQIPDSVAAKLKQQKNVDDPVDFYKGKEIKVQGKIFLEDERPYIRIEEPEQIDIVESDKKSRTRA
jgi:hypothetical protein